MAGAAIVLLLSEDAYQILATADEASAAVVDVEFSLGEGPGWRSRTCHGPVSAWDLRHDIRWPVYSSVMDERGIRAVFVIPLMAGPTQLGALELFRETPGRLLGQQLETARDLAAVAADVITTSEVPQIMSVIGTSRVHVYVAQGMLRSQLDCTLPEAMARLRAHAYAAGRTLSDVARDVASHALVLPDD